MPKIALLASNSARPKTVALRDLPLVPVRAADEDRDEAPRAKKARVAVSCASFHDDEFARASRDALDLGGGATLLALDPGQFAAAVARVGALAEET